MSTLSEAYRDNPLHLRYIIPLDFNSVQSVPESHLWSNSDDSLNLQPSTIIIPTIDMESPHASSLVRRACEEWGIFQLKGHGIPSSLLQDVESEAWKFFRSPADVKLKALRSPGGATGYGMARVSPFFEKYFWHEGFTIIGSSSHDPAKLIWPHDYQRFCDVMDEYQEKMKELSQRLIHLIFDSLYPPSKQALSDNPDWGFCSSDPGNKACTALQLNHYPPCPDPDPDRVMGLPPHTDTFLFTILHQSHANGLQIFRDSGRDGESGWVPVNRVNGALVVNVGDLLHILSNGRYRSVLHRVALNEMKERLSAAYFYGPPPDSRVGPVMGGSGREMEAPRYKSLTVKEYVTIKGKHLDKALSLISI